MSGFAFFTGFPGFIGKRLVAKLLREDPDLRIAALVEQTMADRARDAASDIDGGDRIEVLVGDIGERGLGLDKTDFDRLAREVTVAFHLAAIYNLAVPYEIAQRVNVEGTGNVLDLCERCDKLERLNYVSTAYVAGTRHGVVYEHELIQGQGWKNHYESTKFQAEVWVREWMGRVPCTIYRPAIVVGDSKTGETQKFDGPYYMLRTISMARRIHLPIPQFGSADAPFNVVPVDFVVDALVALATDPETVGETLHLVDPEPISSRALLRALAEEYADKGPAYRLPPQLIENSLRLGIVRNAFAGAPQESITYLNHDVRFDTRRADELLARHGMRCPRFEEYIGPMVDFFREHEDDDAFVPA